MASINAVPLTEQSKKPELLDPKSLTKIYLNGKYEDVDLAVKYAQEAFYGPWSKLTGLQRTECFHRLAALLEDELVPVLSPDSSTSGNPVSIIPTREKT
ncbi:Hypothetical protein R9X50_00666700 [Acrodontium crateriforme]|uniref:Aldehyde dehydrogenase domain-containing protein n=1 Tax=Acrodontium crateriforme TaxID=150365 RepID=A0AAQ3M8R5_9PEZI|nr:Hypothetical protein R9X50_00666700 [Acrodontium crateriforme]